MKRKIFYCWFVVVFFTFSTSYAYAREILFSDGFESGEISAGGWAYGGALTVDGTSYSGSYAARIDDAGFMEKVVDTRGYEDILLQYAGSTYGYDSGEYLNVEWSTDGSSWKQIESFRGSWRLNEVALGAEAAGQPTLFIRFRSNAGGLYERFRIDDITVTGTGRSQPNTPPHIYSRSVQGRGRNEKQGLFRFNCRIGHRSG